ncbi:MAG: ABC transporter permease [Waddliaceae bacterium]|nr:ABC transporter permease [Waddliaceae bacterium]
MYPIVKKLQSSTLWKNSNLLIFWHLVQRVLASLGAYVYLLSEVTRIIIRRPPPWTLVRDQMYNIGVLSLPIIAFTGFSTGLVLAAQSFFQLSDKGLESATGLMVAKAMTVELGPVLTAFMITGRVGAAMCAELGTMRVTEQIDALKSMAVNPIRYLLAPRFIAGFIMVPFLTLFSCLMGIWGAYLLSVRYFHMDPNTFLDPLPLNITTFDIFSGFTKSALFGIIVTSIACYKGFGTSGGASGVGRATTSSVVASYATILGSNFLLTLFMNSFYSLFQRWVATWL